MLYLEISGMSKTPKFLLRLLLKPVSKKVWSTNPFSAHIGVVIQKLSSKGFFTHGIQNALN